MYFKAIQPNHAPCIHLGPKKQTTNPSHMSHNPLLVLLLLTSDPSFWFCGAVLISVSGLRNLNLRLSLSSCQALTTAPTPFTPGTQDGFTDAFHLRQGSPAWATEPAAPSDRISFSKAGHLQTGMNSNQK